MSLHWRHAIIYVQTFELPMELFNLHRSVEGNDCLYQIISYTHSCISVNNQWPVELYGSVCDTFRRLARYGWIVISQMITGWWCALSIPITVGTNYQTRYIKLGERPVSIIWVICKLAVHGIDIHTAQYLFATLCKLHTVPKLKTKG